MPDYPPIPDDPLPPPAGTGDVAPDDAASGNAASNGHWVRDEFGPRDYVAPAAAAGQPPADIIALVRAALSAQAGLDADRIHLAVDGGSLTLAGRVGSAAQRRQVVAAARGALPGHVVQDSLVIDDTLSGGPQAG